MSRQTGSTSVVQRLATDNDLDERIANGCRRRLSNVLIASIRDFGLGREQDAAILEWAARTGHVVITHDASTMTAAAYERLRDGVPLTGLIVVPQMLGVGEAVRRLVDLLEREVRDLEGRVVFL